ncbi:hypothetical protein NGRA_0579 [Nosema granulosis]|uniref:Uncharacterized protein n=1 Tax=Nosema granulosis TaxID=83296 RepID=A0A9P6KZG1_9MICR|nr:hypothetical protein NGRA_0579 [Nosema granulosis]
MDLLRKPKVEELKNAIENRSKHVIVVYGPPGSLKTTATSQICSQLGLSLEYVPDISNYKNKLLNKNNVCLTDIDSHEYINKHKSKIENMRNLIIETRSLQNIWRYLKNCKVVELRKVCSSAVKKLILGKMSTTKKIDGTTKKINITDTSIEAIDGNLHRLSFYFYCNKIENIDIYRYLGRLFYSKNITDSSFNSFKITNYLFNNSIYFIQEEDLYDVYDGFSLSDSKLEEFYGYSEYLVFSSKKKNLGKFSFKSSNLEETHFCTKLCRQFKNSK